MRYSSRQTGMLLLFLFIMAAKTGCSLCQPLQPAWVMAASGRARFGKKKEAHKYVMITGVRLQGIAVYWLCDLVIV